MLTQIWINQTQLADGVCGLVAPVRMPGKNAVQITNPLRSLGPVNFNRLSKSYDVQFDIVRIHASPICAVQFRAQHNQNDIINVADFQAQWTDGTITVTAIIPGAAWQEVDPQLIGEISTRTSYRLSGGPIAVTKVDSSNPVPIATESGLNIETESGETITQ